MKLFFTHKEIALKKKRTALVVIGIGLVIGIYLIVSHRPAKMPELPVVAIAHRQRKTMWKYMVNM